MNDALWQQAKEVGFARVYLPKVGNESGVRDDKPIMNLPPAWNGVKNVVPPQLPAGVAENPQASLQAAGDSRRKIKQARRQAPAQRSTAHGRSTPATSSLSVPPTVSSSSVPSTASSFSAPPTATHHHAYPLAGTIVQMPDGTTVTVTAAAPTATSLPDRLSSAPPPPALTHTRPQIKREREDDESAETVEPQTSKRRRPVQVKSEPLED